MQLRRKPIAAAITGGITDGLTGPIVGAAASASNDPLWTQDFSTAQLIPGATHARASTQLVETDTGALYEVPVDAIPIRGARPVRSLVKDVVPTAESTSFSAWTAVNTASISGDGLTVSLPAASDNIRLDVSTDGVQNGRTYAASFWLTGNGTLTLRVRDRFGAGPDDIGDQVVTLTSTPQRFSVAHQFSDDQTNGIRVYLLRGASDTATEAVLQSPGYLIQEITHRAALSTAPDEFIDPDTDYGTGVAGFRYFLTALANTVDGSGKVTELTGAALTGIALANVPGATNLADGTHDFSGGADTITLSSTGYYTLWLGGTAQVTIAAGTATITGAGSATEGSPVTINCTATGTVALTLDSGTLDEVNGSQVIMLEPGTVPTAFIPTSGSTASTDAAVLDFSGVTGFVTPNETRVVATGIGANLVTNGDFSDGATGWTLETGWSIADESAACTGSARLYQTNVVSTETTYLVLFEIANYVSGAVSPYLGNVGYGDHVFNTDGAHGALITVPSGANATLYFDGHPGGGKFAGSIDNVQVFEIDPTDTTERTIDIDNWDGTDLSDILPHANIISVTQYAPGERP